MKKISIYLILISGFVQGTYATSIPGRQKAIAPLLMKTADILRKKGVELYDASLAAKTTPTLEEREAAFQTMMKLLSKVPNDVLYDIIACSIIQNNEPGTAPRPEIFASHIVYMYNNEPDKEKRKQIITDYLQNFCEHAATALIAYLIVLPEPPQELITDLLDSLTIEKRGIAEMVYLMLFSHLDNPYAAAVQQKLAEKLTTFYNKVNEKQPIVQLEAPALFQGGSAVIEALENPAGIEQTTYQNLRDLYNGMTEEDKKAFLNYFLLVWALQSPLHATRASNALPYLLGEDLFGVNLAEADEAVLRGRLEVILEALQKFETAYPHTRLIYSGHANQLDSRTEILSALEATMYRIAPRLLTLLLRENRFAEAQQIFMRLNTDTQKSIHFNIFSSHNLDQDNNWFLQATPQQRRDFLRRAIKLLLPASIDNDEDVYNFGTGLSFALKNYNLDEDIIALVKPELLDLQSQGLINGEQVIEYEQALREAYDNYQIPPPEAPAQGDNIIAGGAQALLAQEPQEPFVEEIEFEAAPQVE